jgi:ABC-type transport system involved in multi-copper enzyme maturation permease subunit
MFAQEHPHIDYGYAATSHLVFAALALAISYFGLVTEAVVGFQGFTRTTASLLSVALYLIPMVSLAMGALSFTGEKGASEVLFSQPVARTEILWGSWWGSSYCSGPLRCLVLDLQAG